MKQPATRTMFMIVAVGAMGALAVSNAVAAEKFQKLSGTQIRAKLAGMEISDEVHWGDVYGRNGTVTTYSMGHKSTGKWSVRKDEFCIDRGQEPGGGCYEVWLSGNRVELRQQGIELPLEGVLAKPTDTR
jgi:hypothetical protein